jgi:flagellar biosynthesis/type III secretory pathway protein FliH
LRKIIKSSNTEQVNTFRLHYFPNIPVSNAGGSGASDRSAADAAGKTDRQGRPSGALSSSPDHDPSVQRAEMERQAYEQGFAKGEQDGRLAAQQETAPLLTALETTLAELDGVRQKIRRHLEQEVVELALHVARKVVRHELTVSKDTIVCVVQEAMTQLDDPGKISIRLNPDDLKKIRAAGETLSSVMDHLDTIHFEEDTGIDCGGCYIQTEYGEIDARIEEQLRTVEEAFRAEMRNTNAQP